MGDIRHLSKKIKKFITNAHTVSIFHDTGVSDIFRDGKSEKINVLKINISKNTLQLLCYF